MTEMRHVLATSCLSSSSRDSVCCVLWCLGVRLYFDHWSSVNFLHVHFTFHPNRELLSCRLLLRLSLCTAYLVVARRPWRLFNISNHLSFCSPDVNVVVSLSSGLLRLPRLVPGRLALQWTLSSAMVLAPEVPVSCSSLPGIPSCSLALSTSPSYSLRQPPQPLSSRPVTCSQGQSLMFSSFLSQTVSEDNAGQGLPLLRGFSFARLAAPMVDIYAEEQLTGFLWFFFFSCLCVPLVTA